MAEPISNILVKDPRILELNDIVTEVRQSEEWEDVKMNILEVGIAKGREEGELIGIAKGEERKLISQVRKKLERGYSAAEIADALEESETFIEKILKLMKDHMDWTDEQIMNGLK